MFGLDAGVEVHRSVQGDHRVAPCAEFLGEVIQRVFRLGEEEQFLAVREEVFGLDGLAQFVQFGLHFVAFRLLSEVDERFEGVDLLLELVACFGGGQSRHEVVLYPQPVLLGVVLQLLFIHAVFRQPSAQFEQFFQPGFASFQRFAHRPYAGGEPSLKDEQGERHVALVLAKGAVVLFLHVLGDGFVQPLLVVAEAEGALVHEAQREERTPLIVAQVFLQPTQEQRVLALGDRILHHVDSGEQVWLQQVEKEAEVLLIAPVGGRR